MFNKGRSMTIASCLSGRMLTLGAAIAALGCGALTAAQDTAPPPAPPASPAAPAAPAAPAPLPDPTAPAPAPAAPRSPAANLPPAQAILDRSIEAMGGREALDKIESSAVKVTLSQPGMAEQGSALFEVSRTKDGKFFMRQTAPNNMGEATVASDGTLAWMIQGGAKPQLVPDQMLKAMKENAETLAGPLTMLMLKMEDYPTIDVVDQVPYLGEESFKLKMVGKDKNERLAFFSTSSGLMRGTDVVQATPFGPMTITINFDDWQEKSGVKVPMKRTLDSPQGAAELVFTDVQFNNVDQNLFVAPPEVVEMARQRDAAQPQPGTPGAPGSPGAPGGPGSPSAPPGGGSNQPSKPTEPPPPTP
jgi:hypothetical protein